MAAIVGPALAEDLGPDAARRDQRRHHPGRPAPAPRDLVARADGVVAGLAVAAAVFEAVDPEATVTADGRRRRPR